MLSKTQKLLFLYVLFILTGITGMHVNLQSKIINSFDLLIQQIGLYIVPIGIVLSIYFLHRVFIFKEFTLLPIWGKIVLHCFSIIFISWGIAGFLSSVNRAFSKGKTEKKIIKIIDNYKRAPKNDYKYSYSYTRYYVRFIDIKTQKEYLIQVREDCYDSLLMQKSETQMAKEAKKHFATDLMNENEINYPRFKEHVELVIPIGALGFCE